jgi:hypothetical protein
MRNQSAGAVSRLGVCPVRFRRLLCERLEPRQMLHAGIPTDDSLGTPALHEDFDPVSELQSAGSWGVLPPPQLVTAPSGNGFIRLANDVRGSNNYLVFDRPGAGAFELVIIEARLRIAPVVGQADGMSIAWLNTSQYGVSGNVAAPLTALAEEPAFLNSIGVGFDIYQNSDQLVHDPDNNHISLHFGNQTIVQQSVPTSGVGGINFANSEWFTARIIIEFDDTNPNVSVLVTPENGTPLTVLDHVNVAGLAPYEGRPLVAARSGGESALQDADNITTYLIEALGAQPNTLQFLHETYTVVEGEGVAKILAVTRDRGALPVTFDYTTESIDAGNGIDYVSGVRQATIPAGMNWTVLEIPIIDDSTTEQEETLRVVLSNSTHVAIGQRATAILHIVDDDDATLAGQWSDIIPLPVVPIHMSLLPDGNAIFWDRIGNAGLWNPTTGAITTPTLPGFDEFCAGHLLLPDGRFLIAGGHAIDVDGVGVPDAATYDTATNTWETLPDMRDNRWYPTLTIQSDGNVLAISGSLDDGYTNNTIPEVYNVDENSWRTLTTASRALPLYPWADQAPNGQIFVSGPNPNSAYLDTDGTGTWTEVATSNYGIRDYGTSAMFLPGMVMIAGGNPPQHGDEFPTRTVEVIDLNAPSPTWEYTGSMAFGARHLFSTVLPTGDILITGGHSSPGFNNAAVPVLPAQIYSPTTGLWTTLAAMKTPRLYHSIAILLPDGRVAVGGGGQPNAAGEVDHPDLEIFSPPYLHKGPRPVVTSAPATVTQNDAFFIQTTDDISDVTLVSMPASTHAYNQNQRFERLEFEQIPGGLRVQAPDDPTLVPPGLYMLFVIDASGVPSVAKIVRVEVPVGQDELTMRHPDGSVYVARSTGTSFTNEPWTKWADVAWSDVRSGDFTGDGLSDLTMRHPNGSVYVARSTGSGFVNEIWTGWADVAWSDVNAGDFTGDGMTDLAMRHPDGSIYVARSTGTGFINERWTGWSDVAWTNVNVGEFSGDGRADLTMRHPNGDVYVARSTGSGFVNEIWTSWSDVAWSDVRIGDFTGDDRNDFTMRHPNGDVYVARSTGSSFVNERWANWSNVGWSAVTVGDFTGDDRADLSMRHPSGNVYVARSTGQGFVNEIWTSWANVGWGNVQGGDFNGDNSDDLTMRHPNGDVYVARSTGTAFVNEIWTSWSDVAWTNVTNNRFKSGGALATRASGGSPSNSLHAASSGTGTSEDLALRQVPPILAAAVQRWQATGADAAALRDIVFRIADLPGTEIGRANGRTIWLDSNAAGWGWHVGETSPSNAHEKNRIDLLSVLTHELGHMLGFEHAVDGIMEEILESGDRFE